MKINLFVLILLCVSGCTTMTKSLPTDHTLTHEKAYVFGHFPLTTNRVWAGMKCLHGTALVVSSETSKKYFLSFDVAEQLPNGYKLFEVSPGLYDINEFTLTHDRHGIDQGFEYRSKPRRGLDSPLSFNAEAGSIYYVGNYSATTSCGCETFTTCYGVSGPVDEAEAAMKYFGEKYENADSFQIHNTISK